MNHCRVGATKFNISCYRGLYNHCKQYILEFINNPNLLKYIDENWNEVLPHILDFNYTVPQDKIDNISERIRKEYIGNTHLIKGNTEQFIQVL